MKIVTEGKLPEIPEANADFSVSDVGIAVDVGTTTVAVMCWSLSERKILAVSSEKNAQSKFGSDVINRIGFAMKNPGGEKIMHDIIVSQLERLFSKSLSVAAQKMLRGVRPCVKKIAITGNSTMLSFVAGVAVAKMAAVPFEVGSKFGFERNWSEISSSAVSVIPPNVKVFFPPVVGAFIGADTICAMVAAEFDFDSEKPLLLADIGTNSEMALLVPKTDSLSSRILCTSAAAGPAFEAANISCGLPSVPGAIDKIRIENGKIEASTIGGKNAEGICGSGLISSVAEFLGASFIDCHGAILDDSLCGKINLAPKVSVSQNDIRNLQLAKSAVRTGIEYLLSRLASPSENLSFLLAGGFGSRINLSESAKIGLIPAVLAKNTSQIGNAALFGASSLLFSETLREKSFDLAKKSIEINMAAVPDFQKNFLKNLDF